jgi:hypothetical protein
MTALRVIGGVLAAAALAVGGYLVGHSGADSLVAAREAGAAAGQEAGAERGAEVGFDEGFVAARERNFDRAYEKAYEQAYAKAFRDAGFAPPVSSERTEASRGD